MHLLMQEFEGYNQKGSAQFNSYLQTVCHWIGIVQHHWSTCLFVIVPHKMVLTLWPVFIFFLINVIFINSMDMTNWCMEGEDGNSTQVHNSPAWWQEGWWWWYGLFFPQWGLWSYYFLACITSVRYSTLAESKNNWYVEDIFDVQTK